VQRRVSPGTQLLSKEGSDSPQPGASTNDVQATVNVAIQLEAGLELEV
jgi:hypothetical protein